jgi:hypothetical protein
MDNDDEDFGLRWNLDSRIVTVVVMFVVCVRVEGIGHE